MLTLFLGAALAQSMDCVADHARLPNPAGATALATLVGFGAGHAYARSSAAPVYAASDALGVGLILTSKAADPTSIESLDAAWSRVVVGSVILAIARPMQTITAAGAAHNKHLDWMQACTVLVGNRREVAVEHSAAVGNEILKVATLQALNALGLNQYSLEAPAVEAWVEEQIRTGAPASDVVRRIKAGDSPFSLPAKPEEPAPGAGQP